MVDKGKEYLEKLHQYAINTATNYPTTNEYILELYDSLADLLDELEQRREAPVGSRSILEIKSDLQEKLKEVRLLLCVIEMGIKR